MTIDAKPSDKKLKGTESFPKEKKTFSIPFFKPVPKLVPIVKPIPMPFPKPLPLPIPVFQKPIQQSRKKIVSLSLLDYFEMSLKGKKSSKL